MPLRVHAVVVTRHGPSSHAQLLLTLEALNAQTRPVDAITLVVCGDARAVRESGIVAASVEGIIQTRHGVSFASAATLAYPRIPQGSAIWLIDGGTIPEPDALAQLRGTLERSPLAAAAAPKLLKAPDAVEIASFGVSMTRFGRTVELAAGEIDQGQHDATEDALGADIRGMLIRSELRHALALDPALGVADLGLDLGVRARLAAGRLVLTSAARVLVTDDTPAAVPTRPSARAFAERRAQLHRRLVYAPAAAVPLHWLALLPLALWRSFTHLVAKRPASIVPEWVAAVTAGVQLPAVAHARKRLRRFRRAGWASVEPLRVTGHQLRRRLDDGHGSEQGVFNERRFFSGGGAWAVLAAFMVSIAAFVSLLAWPALGGGGLLPLRGTVAALWRDAAWGVRGIGIDVVGPADPFAGVVAMLGSLWPGAPSYALVLVWLFALPLAVLGGWFAATRVTERSGLRILGGVLWALAPTFLTALTQGRPAAVLLHLLLPWLFFTASVAHRSWGASGAASLLLAAVLACAPSLLPAAAVLWVLALVLAGVMRRGHGLVRLIWLPVPAIVLFAPLAWWQLRHGDIWSLFADPGYVWAGPQATPDAAGRFLVATGFPSADLAGWASLGFGTGWVPVLLAPLALLALAAAVAPRWRAGVALLVVVAAGVGTALLAVGMFVSFTHGTAVAIWPGSGLSLAWTGLVGAALVTLDTALPISRVRTLAAAVAGLALVVCALPALTALARDSSHLTNGPTSTLPAYVAADARGDLQRATLLITPLGENTLSARAVWGFSDTLSAQSTLVTAATEPVGADVSELAVALLSPRVFDAAEELASHGIRYVLVATVDEESDGARELRLSATGALSQRAGLVRAGETERGVLWRTDVEARAPELSAAEQATARQVTTITLVVLLVALLLALPTRASRRAARSRPRIVGGAEDLR